MALLTALPSGSLREGESRPPAMIDQDRDTHNASCDKDLVESPEVRIKSLPVGAQLYARIGQSPTPGERTQKSVKIEPQKIHAGDSGRKGDECSDNGQKP